MDLRVPGEGAAQLLGRDPVTIKVGVGDCDHDIIVCTSGFRSRKSATSLARECGTPRRSRYSSARVSPLTCVGFRDGVNGLVECVERFVARPAVPAKVGTLVPAAIRNSGSEPRTG